MNNHCRCIFDGDCLNFQVEKIGLFPLAIKWLIALLVLNIFQGSTVSAQSTLERLEQQIRQRVAPSQEGTVPRRRSATSPSPVAAQPQSAYSLDNAQDSAGPETVYLGVTADDRKDRGRGVRITEVRPGSPAEQAGFHNQDLVTALTGVRVRQLSEMTEILRLYRPDEIVEFEILRDGMAQKLQVTLGRRPIAPSPISQTAEVISLPPGELILPETPPAKIAAPPAQTSSSSDREKIEQMQKHIVELERRMVELERALTEERKNNK